jgi:magnesium transporter
LADHPAQTFTGLVLRHYLGTANSSTSNGLQLVGLSQLALFIPLLIGAGGNAGSQVTTTITRAIAIGEIKVTDGLVVFTREIFIAVIIGAALGLIGFVRGFVFWGSGLSLSLVVGLSLPAIVIWAAAVGSLLPLAAKRLGIDPAVMSAPFITTFVDATGLIIYFEIAKGLLAI